MIFEDIFYPDNPQRRLEVMNLQADARMSFQGYKDAWNHFVNILNPCFDELKGFQGLNDTGINHEDFSTYKLESLSYNIETDNVGLCINQINNALQDAKSKLDKFVKDIGLTESLPNLQKGFNEDSLLEIERTIMMLIPSVTLSAFATYYAFYGVRIMIAIVNLAGAAISGALELFLGVFAGLIVGGVAFIVSDAILSAIHGAIERKHLEEAIEALNQFKKEVSDPVREAGDKIRGILQSIKDGVYTLSDEFMLVRAKDGTYKIIKRV